MGWKIKGYTADKIQRTWQQKVDDRGIRTLAPKDQISRDLRPDSGALDRSAISPYVLCITLSYYPFTVTHDS